MAYPGAVQSGPAAPAEGERRWDWEAVQGDIHVRSAADVIGYDIRAADGEIGHVEDFLLDDRAWAIR